MNVYPIGNNLTVKWTLRYSDGTVFPLSLYDYELCYRTSRGVKVATDTIVEDNVLRWILKADDQVVSGPYSLALKITLAGNKAVDLQYNNAFALTSLCHGNGANVEVCIESNCDVIDLKDAVLQSRKAMDLAAGAVKSSDESAKAAAAAQAAAEKVAGEFKNTAQEAQKAAQEATANAQNAQASAATASEHITSLNEAIAELPDGQAVSEKVAEHTVKLTKIDQLLQEGYQFIGVATPETNPSTPDQKVFYIANGKGPYSNFGGINVDEDEVVLLTFDNTWKKLATGIASNSKLTELGQYVENPEWVRVVMDSDGKILYGVKTDGKFYFGDGCPPQVQEYVQNIIDGLNLVEYEDIVAFLSDYLGSDTTLKTLLDTKLDAEGLDHDALGTAKIVGGLEYIQVTTDGEDKILEGITSEGVKQVNIPVNTPSATIEHIENPEWISVTTDSEGKILGGRKTDGTVVENCDVEYPNGVPAQIQEYVDEQIEIKKTISPFFRSCKVYSVCNDINSDKGESLSSRNYSSRVYIDHFYRGLSTRPKICVDGKKNFVPIYSLYEQGYMTQYINSSVKGETKDVNTSIEQVKVIGNGAKVNDETLTINHISTRNLATENAHVRLLCIGDSVTAGSNAGSNKPYANAPETYWEWVQALFEMDKIENGNSGFDCVTLGNRISLPIDVYGHGNQWKTLEKKTFDINFNGITKSNVDACAVAQAGASAQWYIEGSDHGNNPFWDDENNKFSLLSWISKYRTLIVNNDGTVSRCDDTNKGSLVTDVNAYNVCEPTHVLLALGYNGRYNSEGEARTLYLNTINTIIQTIKTEFPNVYILLSLPDTAGTYFPELFGNYIQESNDIYSLDFTKGIAKSTHDAIGFMNNDLMGLENISNKIYYVPSYFVSPLCYGASYRSADDICYLSSKEGELRQMIESGTNGPFLHPNNTAHAAWAYQIYSLIKYTLI